MASRDRERGRRDAGEERRHEHHHHHHRHGPSPQRGFRHRDRPGPGGDPGERRYYRRSPSYEPHRPVRETRRSESYQDFGPRSRPPGPTGPRRARRVSISFRFVKTLRKTRFFQEGRQSRQRLLRRSLPAAVRRGGGPPKQPGRPPRPQSVRARRPPWPEAKPHPESDPERLKESRHPSPS